MTRSCPSPPRVRLRALNASNARTYNLGLTDGRPFALVATDGGFLAQPQRTGRLLLASSERAEIVVDIQPGRPVILRSYPTGVGGGRFPDRLAGADDSFDLVRLVPAAELEPSPALPERLPAPAPTVAPPDAAHRVFTFNHASRINGRTYDPGRIDFTCGRARSRRGSCATDRTTSTCSTSTA